MIKNRSIFASLPRTQRGMPLVLGGDPKGKNFLYANGNFVIIRDITYPEISDVYTEHSAPTTVAKYSPSGYYICSADLSGKVRIWDTTQKEHILKNEFQPFAGTIKDLAWSMDNQRIVVVGEGREKFGHVFMMETGSSVGEIAGHSKIINSCDFKPTRPFRIITGGEDNIVGIYEGPPFKFKQQLEDHSKYVQSVRFSPKGDLFASAGFDGKIFLYDSKDYKLLGELAPSHQGGVYAICWSPDGKKLMSASGDRSVKVWDIEKQEVVQEYIMGNDTLDQQVSCLWQGSHLLSVSLSGFINYLDPNGDKPIKIVRGHNKSITALAANKEKKKIYTGSHDGIICSWTFDGENDIIKGKGHFNQIQDMKVASSGDIYTIGLDDTLRIIDGNNEEFKEGAIKFPSQPKAFDFVKNENLIIVAAYSHILLIDMTSSSIVYSFPVNYEPSSISFNNVIMDVAVGGAKDSSVHVYHLEEGDYKLTEKKVLHHREGVCDVCYSNNGKYLAACDSNRKVVLYGKDYEAIDCEWGYHTAKVNCVRWGEGGLVASGSLDTSFIVWDVNNLKKYIHVKRAHPQSQITRLIWLNPNTICTTGQDSNIKIWTIE